MKCPADGAECDALWCCKDQCLRQMAAEGEAKAREMRAVHPFYRAGYEAAKAEMADKGHAIGGDGWKLVPVEPTPAMIDALRPGRNVPFDQAVKSLWADLLAASPSPPATDNLPGGS